MRRSFQFLSCIYSWVNPTSTGSSYGGCSFRFHHRPAEPHDQQMYLLHFTLICVKVYFVGNLNIRRSRAVIFSSMTCVAVIMSACSEDAAGQSIEYWQEREQHTVRTANGSDCDPGSTYTLSLGPSVSAKATGITSSGWGEGSVTLDFESRAGTALNIIAGDTTPGDERRGLLGGELSIDVGESVTLSAEDFNRGQLEATSLTKIDFLTVCFDLKSS